MAAATPLQKPDAKPKLTGLKLVLRTESCGRLFLLSATSVWNESSKQAGEIGRNWKSTTDPGTRENFALMMACFCLNGADTDEPEGFRFRDTRKHSIKGVIGQKTGVKQWDHDLFPEEGLKAVCCHSNGEILLSWALRPSQITIEVDECVIWPTAPPEKSSTELLKSLIRKLVGNVEGEAYINRHSNPSRPSGRKTVAVTADSSQQIDLRLTQSAEALLQSLEKTLLCSTAVQAMVATEFNAPDLATAGPTNARKLAENVVAVSPQEGVEKLMRLDHRLRTLTPPDTHGAGVIADLYLAFLPAIINHHGATEVRLLLEEVVGLSSGPVIMPFSSRTILALYLAAIDGTPVKLSRRAAQGLEVPGDHIFPEIPEAGFQNGSVNQSTVLQHIVQQMGGLPEGFLNWTAEDQLLEAQDRLRRSHLTLKNTKGLVLSRQLTPNQEEALREILSYVAIVYLTTKRSEHQHLISPFSLGSLLPPPPPPDRPE